MSPSNAREFAGPMEPPRSRGVLMATMRAVFDNRQIAIRSILAAATMIRVAQ